MLACAAPAADPNLTCADTSLAGKDDLVPAAWSDTDAHFVVPKHPTVNGDGVEHIRLRSFGTGVHKVDGSVAVRSRRRPPALSLAVPRRRLCLTFDSVHSNDFATTPM